LIFGYPPGEKRLMNLLGGARQPFVGLALAGGFGILISDLLASHPLPIISLASLFAVGACVSFLRPTLVRTYLIVGLGFFLLHNVRTTDASGQRLADSLGSRPRAVTATGAVVSEPTIGRNGFATFLLKLKSVDVDGTTQPTNATWQVRWRRAPDFGDELKLFGVAQPIEPPRNPGEFDFRSYLARMDVRQLLLVRYPENAVLLRHGGGNPVLRAAQNSRAWLQNSLCRGLDDAPDVQSFLSGIVLGLRHQTPEDIEEPFQQTGTLHLFAVAGLHVGIFAQLLWILSKVARLPQKLAGALIIPALFFYAAVTGLHVSSIRAAIMASVLIGGVFFDRKVFLLNSLAAAAFILLCRNTNELFATGFQLSFSVVGAIILFADPIFNFFRRCSAPDPFLPRSLLRGVRSWMQHGWDWLCRGASVSLAAWGGSTLLLFRDFYLVTPISLFANLVIVPIAFFVLAIALLSVISAQVWPWLSLVFNNANWSLGKLVLALVQLFAQTPGGHFYMAHPHRPEMLIAKITVLDVGAGAAVHVRTPDADWLFDCGSERDYQRAVRHYLHAAGVNRLTGVALTHGDSFHIGGALLLLDDLAPTRWIDNPSPDKSNVHKKLRQRFQELRINPAALVQNDTFQISPDVMATILYPPRGFTATKADDQAYVIRVLVKPTPTSILFMSDSGEPTERRLLESGIDLRSDILVKGQHQSGQSGSAEFLAAVQPKLIVSTASDFPWQERMGDEWAAAVCAGGITLFRQDETGAVALRFTQRGWEARSYLTGETFRSASR
jgi:competence protein ComEC